MAMDFTTGTGDTRPSLRHVLEERENGALLKKLDNKPASEVARASTQVEIGFTRIKENNERMAKLVDHLEQRIGCVLGPRPPEERANGDKDARPMRSGLTTGLHNLADEQEAIMFRLGAILERLEL